MKLKLIALSGMMAITMGLTACDSNKENAAEDVADAQDNIVDAQEELNEAEVTDPAAEQAGAAVDDAADATATAEMDAEVPVDGTATNMDMDPDAVDAADDVVVVEPAPAAQ